MIYLASPIDQAVGNGKISHIRAMVTMRCLARAVSVYNPHNAFDVSANVQEAAGIAAINARAVDQCDGMIAILPKGVPSIGVPMEIQRAALNHTPVAVIGSNSLMFNEYYEYVTTWEDTEPETLDAALDMLLEDVEENQKRPGPQILWKGDPVCEPKRGYAGDAGFDLVVAQDTRVHVDQFVDVNLGISVQMPEGVWAMLTGRSSTLRKRGLLVTQGIIDNGYRGELYAGCRNLSGQVVELKRGERVAQLIPYALQAPSLELQQVTELTPTERGENGFGSTGV